VPALDAMRSLMILPPGRACARAAALDRQHQACGVAIGYGQPLIGRDHGKARGGRLDPHGEARQVPGVSPGGAQAGAGGGLAHEGEDIEVLELGLDEAMTMMATGAITDAKTIMMLQALALRLAAGDGI